MNQINKILSGLKKRRTSTSPEDAPAEAAHAQSMRNKIIQNKMVSFAVLAFVALSVAGGLWLWLSRTPASPVKTAQAPPKAISTPKPATAPTAAQAGAVKEELAQAEATSQPVAEADQEKTPEEAGVAKPESVMASTAKSESREKASEKVMPEDTASREAIPDESELPPAQEKKETAKNDKQEPPVQAPVSEQGKAIETSKKKQEMAAVSSVEPEMEGMAPEAEAMADAGGVDKQVKPLSAEEQANNEFIKASGLAQRGNIKEALAGYETVLHLAPGYEAARQAMVVLLLQAKRNADAERVLQEGLGQNIKNSGFAMLLARIQLDRDAPWSALLTLQKTLPYAVQQADYQAFVAALLQRLSRHKEAVVHYRMAVELAPDSGVWWMGMGISLKALQQTEDARTAFRRALQSNTLSADLRDFVTRQLRTL